MANFVHFHEYAANVLKGVHDFSSNTFKVAFTNTAPDLASDAVLADITQISAGNGYTTGGVTLDNVVISRTTNDAEVRADDETFTASGGSVGPFRYLVVYDDTSASDSLIGMVDNGSSITLADGGSLLMDLTDADNKLTNFVPSIV